VTGKMMYISLRILCDAFCIEKWQHDSRLIQNISKLHHRLARIACSVSLTAQIIAITGLCGAISRNMQGNSNLMNILQTRFEWRRIISTLYNRNQVPMHFVWEMCTIWVNKVTGYEMRYYTSGKVASVLN
jgi:hypothetical protein